MKKIIIFIAALALFLSLGMGVQAATYSDFTSGDLMLSQPALSPVYDYVPFIHYREFDFGNANINDGSGVTDGDVVPLFNVDANTFIEEFGIRVTTAALQSGTSGVVGDGNDANGYVGSDNAQNADALSWIDLANTSSGVSAWRLIGPVSSGTSYFAMAGVSNFTSMSGTGVVAQTFTVYTNLGPYFTDASGASPYLGNGDTIDMTMQVDKTFAPGTGWSGVTPVFEAYIRGFKRVVP